MDIEGRLIIDLGVQTGTSKAGNPWKKRECVLETFGPYPKKVKFHIFGEKVDSIVLEQGKDYLLSFDLESREYNGRWYTDVSVYRAQLMDAANAPSTHQQTNQNPFNGESTPQPVNDPLTTQPQDFDPFGGSNDETEDLPF